ncbi:hypothetical protein GCM10011519_18620 [Marmoricola endophyticus]|uniref:Glycosyltransferase 2-like domain-containing protein n=1 Tax=Marmoricola endophyticus TaxID=2040280 RepID=A0A917BK77_9ACTN|nr:glycosyltransferase family 2 protein [Marmoricola endophyticus]GGF45058.1 hypothetical protein GCM10011519_18620 [Marmoricola endophyticus]
MAERRGLLRSARDRVRPLRASPGHDGPLLSVVVPVYNVARWLPATMDTLLAQPVRDVEVVVIDDGSSDDTLAVAHGYAARDPRVRVMTQPNSGVSIARNTAVPTCRGEFLTFADGDDVLPADAWTTMLRTLRRTGSDFVVGNAVREELPPEGPESDRAEPRRFVTPLMKRNHGEDRFGLRIEDAPLLLADIFVWNKVFRTAFFTGADGTEPIHFPERTRYQDQVALTQAFLKTRHFDVLTETVYVWRVRPDRTSATQVRWEQTNLVERMTTKDMTVAQVLAHGGATLAETLFTEVLPIDMWEHFRRATVADDAYWSTLRDGTRRIWHDGTVPFERTRVPPQQRLMGWLTVRDRRADLQRWVARLDAEGPTYDGDVLVHPWSDEVVLSRG